MGCVTTFPSTHVVRLSIEKGLNEIHTLHDILNTGPFERREEYEFVPHVTLCHDFTDEACSEHLSIATQRWNDFLPAPPLLIDQLTMVQQASDDTWVDVEDLPLGRLQPVRVRR
jgi:hypothetical protein